MELLVCAVHPIPGRFYFLWTTKLSNHGGKIGSQVLHFTFSQLRIVYCSVP